jgi:hypothetical protein
VICITDVVDLLGNFLSIMEWKPIDTAPFDRDLELAVIDGRTTRLIAFPCRRVTAGESRN